MTFARRRLSFQLTPLLDLLLIVIFAQYMDVEQSASAIKEAAEEQQQALAVRSADLEASYEKQSELLQRAFQDRLARLNAHQRRTQQQLAEAFDLPGQVVEQVARLQNAGRTGEAARLRDAATRLRQALRTRGDELMRLLVKADEMQKHVTIWEVHLTEGGQAWLTDGSEPQVLGFANPTEFVDKVFQASKSMAEPKTLVLILLTYGDTQAKFRRDAVAAMPSLTDQLRRDAGNTRWYDYSLLGFRPEGPIFAKLEGAK